MIHRVDSYIFFVSCLFVFLFLPLYQSCALFFSLLPFFLSTALYFYLWTPDITSSITNAGVKSAPALLLAAAVLSWNGGQSFLGVVGGLVFSAVGDFCLVWPELFLHGKSCVWRVFKVQTQLQFGHFCLLLQSSRICGLILRIYFMCIAFVSMDLIVSWFLFYFEVPNQLLSICNFFSILSFNVICTTKIKQN